MMKKSPYLTTLLSFCCLSMALAVTVNLAVDPMHYYHQPWFDIGFSDNQRFQNPGLARTADYDVVVIGTSHTEPFTTRDMDQKLGGKSLNLSMSGALIAEQRLLLDVVLEAGKAKRVLWEINYRSFSLGDTISQPDSFPFFLFRAGAETPFLYLMSWETLMESFRALSGQRAAGPDELHRWDLDAEFGEERVLAHWDFLNKRWNDEQRVLWSMYEVSDEKLVELVQYQVMGIIRQHPDVQFDLLFLPSSMLDYASDFLVSTEQNRKRKLLRREIAAQAGNIGNVRLWDFQLVDWMNHDMAHYKDVEHFDQQVIQAILSDLSSGRHQVPALQLDSNTQVLGQDIVAFIRRFCRTHPERCQPVLREHL
jgi:hypothetical protein